MEAAINWYRANDIVSTCILRSVPTLEIRGAPTVVSAVVLPSDPTVCWPARTASTNRVGGHLIVDQSPDHFAQLLIVHLRSTRSRRLRVNGDFPYTTFDQMALRDLSSSFIVHLTLVTNRILTIFQSE